MADPEISPAVPLHDGFGLASLVLGALFLPLAAWLGVQSLAVALPIFGLWFFLPVVLIAIVLGMIACRNARGVAGAALGVAALVLCLTFVIVERMYGQRIREQLRPPSAVAVPADVEKAIRGLVK